MLWEELGHFIETNGIKISNNELNFAMYHDQEYKETDVDVEVCATVDKIGDSKNGFVYRKTEAIQTMACTMVYGTYENLSYAYLSFADWLTQHNQHKMTDKPNRQICHRGSWNEENSDKYLTKIQVVVENKNSY